jgi:hypothetical protein
MCGDSHTLTDPDTLGRAFCMRQAVCGASGCADSPKRYAHACCCDHCAVDPAASLASQVHACVASRKGLRAGKKVFMCPLRGVGFHMC